MSWLVPAIISAVLWPLYVAAQVPLWLAGLPICYRLARREAWTLRPSQYFKRDVTAWGPRWAWLWGNEENGITGPDWWHTQNAGKPEWRIAFVWSAWRNPVNNLRFVPLLNPVIVPDRIRFRGNADDPARKSAIGRKRVEWSFTWQGIYAGLVVRWQITATHHAQFRAGWKFIPRDRFGVATDDYRSIRCPFGVQLHLWRKS